MKIINLKNDAQRDELKKLFKRNLHAGRRSDIFLEYVQQILEKWDKDRDERVSALIDNSKKLSFGLTATLGLGAIPQSGKSKKPILVEEYQIFVTNTFYKDRLFYVSDGTYAFSFERADDDYRYILTSIIEEIENEIAENSADYNFGTP